MHENLLILFSASDNYIEKVKTTKLILEILTMQKPINNYSRKTLDTNYNLVFDWGNTLMKADLPYSGPMADWLEVQAVPGIQNGLKKLQDFPKYVATNAGDSNQALVNKALERVQLNTFFENIFTSRDLNFYKPQPEFFSSIAKNLDENPKNLVMIGDSYPADVLGAHQAGWSTLWYNPSCQPCPGLLAVHQGEIYDMENLDETLQSLSLPDWNTCLQWQMEFNFPNNLWMHSQAVAGVAYLLALWLKQKGENVNPILAQRGGLLHDLAKLHPEVNRTNGNDHGVLAGKILNQRGQPELAEIAIRHMIFSFEISERVPSTWEEILVYFADKLIEGKEIVSIQERLAALQARYKMNSEKYLPVLTEVQERICRIIQRSPEKMLQDLKDHFYTNQN